MSTVSPPRAGIPIGMVTIKGQRLEVVTHPEFTKFFDSLTSRVGGATGPGTLDLTVAQFEDAGIPEMMADIYSLRDAASQEHTITALREEVFALTQRVQSLESGVSL
jgi:hypothetical protein